MSEYFFADNPGFGPISWLLLLAWAIGLGGGFYLYQVWRESNPVRNRFVRRSGLGLAIVSGLGLLVLLLKATGIEPIDYRIWTYVAVVLTVGYLVYTAYFATQRLPQLVGATRATPGRPGVQRGNARTYGAAPKRGSARTYAANGNGSTAEQAAPAEPRPVATTTRRDARRNKKRKSR